jgi:hypothetical protein
VCFQHVIKGKLARGAGRAYDWCGACPTPCAGTYCYASCSKQSVHTYMQAALLAGQQPYASQLLTAPAAAAATATAAAAAAGSRPGSAVPHCLGCCWAGASAAAVSAGPRTSTGPPGNGCSGTRGAGAGAAGISLQVREDLCTSRGSRSCAIAEQEDLHTSRGQLLGVWQSDFNSQSMHTSSDTDCWGSCKVVALCGCYRRALHQHWEAVRKSSSASVQSSFSSWQHHSLFACRLSMSVPGLPVFQVAARAAVSARHCQRC